METILKTSKSLHEYLVNWQNYVEKNNTISWYDDDLPKIKKPILKRCFATDNLKNLGKNPICDDGFELIEKRKFKVKKDKCSKKITGKITRWLFHKNYGFIKSNQYNVPIFIHQSDITSDTLKNLGKSYNVYFELQKDKTNRLVAKNCKIY